MVAVNGPYFLENILGAWAVPGRAAAWIPAGIRHNLNAIATLRARTIYFRRDVVTKARRSCATLELTPLMHALIDHASSREALHADTPEAKHLFAVIVDQLPQQRELPLFVPTLRHPLARRVADALAADPADTPRIRDLAAAMGVSTRTIDRAFTADAAMTLGEWRQRSRMCRAIALLAEGMAVKEVALEVGYEAPSAFVAAFKKSVGMTPGRTG